MQKRKSARRNQFIEVQEQIQSISNEIYGPREYNPAIIDENDLSLRKLEELHRQLHALQKEKVNNLLLICVCVCVCPVSSTCNVTFCCPLLLIMLISSFYAE